MRSIAGCWEQPRSNVRHPSSHTDAVGVSENVDVAARFHAAGRRTTIRLAANSPYPMSCGTCPATIRCPGAIRATTRSSGSLVSRCSPRRLDNRGPRGSWATTPWSWPSSTSWLCGAHIESRAGAGARTHSDSLQTAASPRCGGSSMTRSFSMPSSPRDERLSAIDFRFESPGPSTFSRSRSIYPVALTEATWSNSPTC